jgi:hypothetical protein
MMPEEPGAGTADHSRHADFRYQGVDERLGDDGLNDDLPGS